MSLVVTFVENVVETGSGRVSYTESGTGAPIILLHSLLTDRRAFDPVLEQLEGRVIAMDLPGFGETTSVAPSIDDYAARVAELIEVLGVDPGEVTLIGNGLGAFVALGVAVHNQIGRLILIGCGKSFSEEARQVFANMAAAVGAGGMEAVVPTALLRIFTEDYLADHPDAGAERAAVLRQTDTEAFMVACQALQSVDYGAMASTIVAPVLIVVGEEDRATPPLMAHELHAVIPDSELVVIPGVAHAPQIQEPSKFMSVITPFMEQR
jgi:3-oxoadipate enol-lactonase